MRRKPNLVVMEGKEPVLLLMCGAAPEKIVDGLSALHELFSSKRPQLPFYRTGPNGGDMVVVDAKDVP